MYLIVKMYDDWTMAFQTQLCHFPSLECHTLIVPLCSVCNNCTKSISITKHQLHMFILIIQHTLVYNTTIAMLWRLLPEECGQDGAILSSPGNCWRQLNTSFLHQRSGDGSWTQHCGACCLKAGFTIIRKSERSIFACVATGSAYK